MTAIKPTVTGYTGPLNEVDKQAKVKQAFAAKGEQVAIVTGNEVYVVDKDQVKSTIEELKKSGKKDFDVQVEFVDKKKQQGGAEALKYVDGQEEGGKKGQVEADTFKAGVDALDIKVGDGENPITAFQKEHNRACLRDGRFGDMIKVDGVAKGETLTALRGDFDSAIAKANAEAKASREAYDASVGDLIKLTVAYEKCLTAKPPDLKGAEKLKGEIAAKQAEIAGHKGTFDQAVAKLEKLKTGAEKYFTPDEMKAKTFDTKGPDKISGQEMATKKASELDGKLDAAKKVEAKPAPPPTDPEVDFRIKTYLNDAGDGDDDLAQIFVRCLAKPQSEWSTSDSKWLLDHGFKPSDLKKIGPEGYARLYAGLMTGDATKGEMLDSFSLLESASKAGQLGPTLQAIAKLPKGQLDDIFEELGDHGKKADFCKWVMVAQGVDEGTRKTLLEHPSVSKDDLKDAYKWTVENAKIIKDPGAYDALIGAIKAKNFEYKEADAMIKQLEADKAKLTGGVQPAKPEPSVKKAEPPKSPQPAPPPPAAKVEKAPEPKVTPASGPISTKNMGEGLFTAKIPLPGGRLLTVVPGFVGSGKDPVKDVTLQFSPSDPKPADLSDALAYVKASDMDQSQKAKLQKWLEGEIAKRAVAK